MALKWGLISTARINHLFLAGARNAPDAEVLGVASRDASAAERYASEHEIERAYGSYEEMLADPEIQAVYIPLPNRLHVDWSVRALEAGKHVLCEKPLSRRAADAQAAFDFAEQRDRMLMEGFMYRHNPQTARVRELVSSGAIGRLRMIEATFSFNAGTGANVRLVRSLDGGALMDVGCYCVNAIRMLGGEPSRVSAEQTLGGDGVDVTFVGTMQCENDVLAHFDCGLALAPRDHLEVVGEDGSLFLEDPWHCRNPVIELRTADETERIEVDPVDSYMLEAENFSRAAQGLEQPLLGRGDAVAQARAIEALYAAAQDGRTVTPAPAS